MGIGAGIFLLVVGAILTFAVHAHVGGISINVVGWICMGAGVLAIILALALNNQRANTSHTAVVEHRETGLPPEEPRR